MCLLFPVAETPTDSQWNGYLLELAKILNVSEWCCYQLCKFVFCAVSHPFMWLVIQEENALFLPFSGLWSVKITRLSTRNSITLWRNRYSAGKCNGRMEKLPKFTWGFQENSLLATWRRNHFRTDDRLSSLNSVKTKISFSPQQTSKQRYLYHVSPSWIKLIFGQVPQSTDWDENSGRSYLWRRSS